MDQEDKIKLARALELSEENNNILKKMLRNMRWGRLFRVLYWVAIIAVSVGALYYVQPYIDQLQKAYGNAKQTLETVNKTLSPTR
jgi:hypothetical protein